MARCLRHPVADANFSQEEMAGVTSLEHPSIYCTLTAPRLTWRGDRLTKRLTHEGAGLCRHDRLGAHSIGLRNYRAGGRGRGCEYERPRKDHSEACREGHPEAPNCYPYSLHGNLRSHG